MTSLFVVSTPKNRAFPVFLFYSAQLNLPFLRVKLPLLLISVLSSRCEFLTAYEETGSLPAKGRHLQRHPSHLTNLMLLGPSWRTKYFQSTARTNILFFLLVLIFPVPPSVVFFWLFFFGVLLRDMTTPSPVVVFIPRLFPLLRTFSLW